jgi:hypothetical protein
MALTRLSTRATADFSAGPRRPRWTMSTRGKGRSRLRDSRCIALRLQSEARTRRSEDREAVAAEPRLDPPPVCAAARRGNKVELVRELRFGTKPIAKTERHGCRKSEDESARVACTGQSHHVWRKRPRVFVTPRLRLQAASEVFAFLSASLRHRRRSLRRRRCHHHPSEAATSARTPRPKAAPA